MIYVVILISVGFGIYAFNLNNPLFWDDTDWIVNNPFVHSFSLESIKNWFTENILAGIGLSSNYYRPFLLFTFTLNYVMSGENPAGYHLLSNAFHVANAILLFLIFLSVFKSKFISFWTSLIWLVHPLQTEAVTYISGRGDPLNVFFMLSALYLLITDPRTNLFPLGRHSEKGRDWCGAGIASRYDKTVNNRPTHQSFPARPPFGKGAGLVRGRHRKSVMWITLILLVLALLSRETAAIFPFLLMVFYTSFLSRARFVKSLKTALVKALPYFGIVFVYGVLRLTVLNLENTLNFYSRTNPYTESLLVRMYTFLNVLWTYAGLMVVPLGQHMERSVTVFTYFWNWPVVLSSLAIVTLSYCLIVMYRKEQFSNIAIQPYSNFRVWFFAAGWFFVNLSMTSGITPINAQLYEHWLYLALLGPLVLVIFYLHFIFKKFNSKFVKVFVILILVSVSVFFSVLSIRRNIIWGKPIEFFEDILKYEPHGARINNNLGNLYYNKDDKEKAEEYYWKAVAVEDNFPQPHFNLGSILQERGDVRGAIVEFEKAIAIDPNFPHPYWSLTVIYASQGDLMKTTDFLEKLKKLTPYDPRVYYNLARVYVERNDNESAYQNLKKGLKYGRFDPETDVLMKELLQRFKQ